MKKKILLLIVVATLGLTAATMAQVPNYVPTNGLVGYWPFNGNANDESGNGNNGTVNGATLTSDRNGNTGKAYSFDGLNDYISATPILPTGSAPRTVSCWFKTIAGSIPTSQYPNVQTMTGWGSCFPGTVIFPQHVVAPSGKAYFETGSSGNQLFSQNAVNDGIWHQIVTTYDGNNSRVKMYIDAMLQDSSTVISLGTAASFFGIGNFSCANIPFQGQIDDVGLWDRALNQQEIIYLFNGCQLSITSQPASQTININNNAQFMVGLSDTNATYQWQTDLGAGFQNLSNAGQYSGTTNDTLSVSNVSMSNNNQPFRCIINNSICADTTYVAVLSVNNCQLSVNAQPTNQTINISNNTQFIVGSSDTNATYQWQTDLGVGFQNLSNAGQYSGTTNDTLSVSNASMSNNNQHFRCIINSGSCTDTSATAVLTVLNNTGINENAQNNLFSVFPNPAQSSLYVKADNKLIGSVFTIYDNIGKVVKSGKLNTANTTIELGNLSNGMYLFSIGDHKKQPFKIIKE